MKISTLEHRHGGRIVSLDAIAHAPNGLRGHAAACYWFFVGAVQWSDGSRSDAAEITPNLIACEDAANNAELRDAFARLNVYLTTRGAWSPARWVPAPAYGKRGRVAFEDINPAG